MHTQGPVWNPGPEAPVTPLLEPSLVHGSGATSQWCWGSKSPCLSLRPHNSQLRSLLALTPAPGLLSRQIPNSRPMICCPTAPCPPVLNPRPPGSKLQQLVLSIAMRCLQSGPSPGLCSSAVTPLLSQAGTWDSTGLRSHPNPQQVGGYSGPLRLWSCRGMPHGHFLGAVGNSLP